MPAGNSLGRKSKNGEASKREIWLGIPLPRANIDAISTAAQFGIQEDFAVDYHADKIGTEVNFEAVNEAVSNLRSGKKLDRSWKKGIERDFNGRTKR